MPVEWIQAEMAANRQPERASDDSALERPEEAWRQLKRRVLGTFVGVLILGLVLAITLLLTT